MGEDVETLKRRTPLLDYLRQHNWTGHPASRCEFVGLCPLHEESRPSFYVNTRKDVFYCHGCGRGGDLIRFVQLSCGLSFRQSLACLDPEVTSEADSSAVLEEAAAFYQQQLDRCPEALDYLHRRGVHDAALFRELCIGYAPGGTLRRYLTAQGHSFDVLRRLGLINVRGADALYVRFQSSLQPPPSATTINDRTATADRAIRNQFPDAPCQVAHGFHQPFLHRRPMGLGRPRFELSRLRVWEPRLNVVPLSVDEVARFWRSFRNARDLAIVGLMLMQGLRSAEVMALNHDDVLFSEGQLRVRGKGNKLRLLPLAPETTQLLDHYLRVERPDPCSAALFVVLKGPARGQRMTPAGLRSLFRHHRRTTGVELANPHQFRHTFASDMVRAGISLPALMQLMGHADIETTMHYVKVSPQDVYLQYARAAAQCIHPQPRIS